MAKVLKKFIVNDEKINSLCSEKNISIRQLEKDSGLSNGTIGKWKTSIPSASSLALVAKSLSVKVEDLLIYREEKV